MKIHANIDDCALIINDFLPKDLFKQIANFNYDQYDKKESFENWEKNLFLDKGNNVTMKEVTTINYLSTLDKGKYEFKNKIFKDVLDVVKNCKFVPFQDNSLLFVNLGRFLYSSGINLDAGLGCGQTSNIYLYEAQKIIFLSVNIFFQSRVACFKISRKSYYFMICKVGCG